MCCLFRHRFLTFARCSASTRLAASSSQMVAAEAAVAAVVAVPPASAPSCRLYELGLATECSLTHTTANCTPTCYEETAGVGTTSGGSSACNPSSLRSAWFSSATRWAACCGEGRVGGWRGNQAWWVRSCATAVRMDQATLPSTLALWHLQQPLQPAVAS